MSFVSYKIVLLKMYYFRENQAFSEKKSSSLKSLHFQARWPQATKTQGLETFQKCHMIIPGFRLWLFVYFSSTWSDVNFSWFCV